MLLRRHILQDVLSTPVCPWLAVVCEFETDDTMYQCHSLAFSPLLGEDVVLPSERSGMIPSSVPLTRNKSTGEEATTCLKLL
jgi:hypothetical protein